MNVTVHGEPVPETSGGASVSFEGAHAACDAEIARLRGVVAKILAAFETCPDGRQIAAAEVTLEQLALWRKRAGLDEIITDPQATT